MYDCVLFDLDDTLITVVDGSICMRRTAILLCASTIIVLEELSRRCALGIVTSSPTPEAIRALRQTGLLSFFQGHVVGSESVHRRKPDPAPLLLAMRRMKVVPGQTLFIGNDAADFEAAQAAGVRFLLAGWSPHTPDAMQTSARKKCEVLSRLDDLPRLCFPPGNRLGKK